jgi:hypothetical protein
MTGDGFHSTHKNGGDLGMVYELLGLPWFTTLNSITRYAWKVSPFKALIRGARTTCLDGMDHQLTVGSSLGNQWFSKSNS